MRKQMTRGEAVLILVRESRKERISKTAYFRACNAVNALDVSAAESCAILHDLEFTDEKGMPRKFITKALGK